MKNLHNEINQAQNITGLSTQEASFLATLAEQEQTIFHFQDALAFWQDAAVARRALSRLAQGGWLKRIERGLYLLIPLNAGPQRQWSENALVIASHLLTPSAIAYWSALHYWQFTEQIPQTIFIQSPRRKAKPALVANGVRYRFIYVQPAHFFGLAEQPLDHHTIRVTDREKSLIDAADRPDLCGGIEQLVEILRGHWAEIDWRKLDADLERYNAGAVYKRLGYLLETLGLPVPDREMWLARWQARLSTGIALLEPEAGKTGHTLRRWRIRDNVGIFSNQTKAS